MLNFKLNDIEFTFNYRDKDGKYFILNNNEEVYFLFMIKKYDNKIYKNFGQLSHIYFKSALNNKIVPIMYYRNPKSRILESQVISSTVKFIISKNKSRLENIINSDLLD
ncbi:MAG: hypothetical protein LC122_14395 [Chitinophagales bacterium]|nr:hypothetical protein [Chitinophagales bacterium]